MRNRTILYYVLGLLLLPIALRAEERPYLCEIGLQGGCGYYVGEAAPHIFQNVRYAAGAHVRYKFTNRWSIRMSGMYQLLEGPYKDYREPDNLYLSAFPKDGLWFTQMANIDVAAEFNFLRFGMPEYDERIKPYTPYLFLGVGVGVLPGPKGNWTAAAAYLPLGIGFKWQFCKWVALHVQWQHNIYFSDDLENVWIKKMGDSKMINPLGNTYDLNKANIMNMDVTSQLTLGIVFAFGQKRKVCRICDQD